MKIIGVLASIFLAFVVAGCQDIQQTIEQKENGVFLIINQNTDPATNDQKGAIGTGFFVGPDQIITNAHVVQKIIENGEQKLYAKLENSDKYEVEVTNIDTGIDLALLKIKDWDKFKKENRITILTFANSRDIQTMDEVFAIGNPWGLTFSVSKGIVSNPMRRVDVVPKFMVQTDAHVYNGNSGGPLLNDAGQVVGINSLMQASDGGSYGFALHADIIKKVLAAWKNKQDVKWAMIGVKLMDPNVIDEVVADTPASKAGLQKGDKIVGMITSKGKRIFDNTTDITFSFALLTDEKIQLIVKRGDKKMNINISPLYKTSKELTQ